MSKTGCWSCGSQFHHRRNCDAAVTQGSAALVKKDSVADHRLNVKKSDAQRGKWQQKLRVRDEPPLPRQFLRHHLEEQLQFLCDVRTELKDEFRVNADQILAQKATTSNLQEQFRLRLADMRAIAANSSNYLHKLAHASDIEDEIFRDTVDHFNEIRPALWSLLSKAIANLNEAERLVPHIDTMILTLELELRGCTSALAERSAGFLKTDASIVAKIKELGPHMKELHDKLELISKLLDDESHFRYQEKVREVQTKYDLLLKNREQKLEDGFEELEEASLCKICMLERKDVAFLCGHQVCQTCLHNMRLNPIMDDRHQPRPLTCPFCKTVVRGTIRLFE